MQDVHVKLKLGFPWQKKQRQKVETPLYQQIGLKFNEESSNLLRLEYSFIWCRNVDTAEGGSEISEQFWNVKLEKDGEDYLDQSREKWRSVKKSPGGEEYPTNNKTEDG